MKKKMKIYGIFSLVSLVLVALGAVATVMHGCMQAKAEAEALAKLITHKEEIHYINERVYGDSEEYYNTTLTTNDGWYTIENGEANIGYYDGGSLKTVEIPSEIDGLKVTALNGFGNSPRDEYYTTEIIVPDSVKFIGSYTFSEAYGLEKITIGKGVVSIEEGTFSNCFELEDVSFGEITSIGKNAFYCCRSLEKLELPDSVVIIGESAFEHCFKLNEINIPKSSVDIESKAFAFCSALSAISIPESVETIGDKAFYDCAITVTAPHEPEYYGYTPDEGVTWIVK